MRNMKTLILGRGTVDGKLEKNLPIQIKMVNGMITGSLKNFRHISRILLKYPGW